jgi:signal transduction histidine kinase
VIRTRRRRPIRGAADPDAAVAPRVGWRLATRTGGLIAALLLVLSVVRDSGPRLALVDLPHLFERFYRADKARSSGGTGVGLAIGRWIAEAHGGHILATNAPQAGALFTVTFPLAAS